MNPGTDKIHWWDITHSVKLQQFTLQLYTIYILQLQKLQR